MPSVSGFTELSSAVLLDRRRNLCAASLFDSLLVSHTGSFSAAVCDAGRQAAHRLFGANRLKLRLAIQTQMPKIALKIVGYLSASIPTYNA